MKRPLILAPIVLALAAGNITATPTAVKIQLAPQIYTAAVGASHGAIDAGYSGLKSTLKVDFDNPTNLNAAFTPDGFPYGAYCVDPDQYYQSSIKKANMIRLNDEVALSSDLTKLGRSELGIIADTRSFNSDSLTTQQRYQHATYLATLLDGATSAQRSAIWGAIWTLTDVGFVDSTLNEPVDMGVYSSLTNAAITGAVNMNTREYWLNQARLNTFTAITDWSKYALFASYTNSVITYHQEFVGQVPEPGAYFLMGTAFLGVFLVVRRNRRMARQVQL